MENNSTTSNIDLASSIQRRIIERQTYETATYSAPHQIYCNHCHRTYQSKSVITYYEHGIKRAICNKCYDRICNTTQRKDQIYRKMNKLIKKKKNAEKRQKQKAAQIHIVQSPYEMITIKERNLSVIEWYVLDRNHYAELRDRKVPGIRLSDEIVSFLPKHKNKLKKSTEDEAIEYLKEQWNILKEKKSLNKKMKAQHEILIENLLESTLNGQVQWFVKLRSYVKSNYLYSVDFQGCTFELSVDAFLNAYGEQKYLFELTRNENGVIYKCPTKYNSRLFNAIRRSEIKKKSNISATDAFDETNNIDKKEEKIIFSNDFIIRTNLFCCYHKEHTVEEIIGIVSIVYPNGKVIQKKVPCGFCKTCGHYFMMNSIFHQLAESGVILAQVISGTEYYQSGQVTKFNVASESILMRNGYNVKAQAGLTDEQRQLILQNILEQEIMQVHQIVSYLDMFIAQKKRILQYQTAINKWERDRDFVLQYHQKDKREVTIKTIRKNKM